MLLKRRITDADMRGTENVDETLVIQNINIGYTPSLRCVTYLYNDMLL